MYDEGIQIVKTTNVSLVKQVVHLQTQECFIPVIDRMVRLMRVGKFTGHIHIQMNQGGVKRIETEQETK